MTLPEPVVAVLVVLSLSGFALAFSRWLDLALEAAFLPAMSVIVLVSYACALLGILWWAPPLMMVSGLGCGALALGLRGPSRPQQLARLLTPGVVLLWVTMGFLWFRLSPERYGHWDEFSHWGLLVKIFRYVHRLPVSLQEHPLLDYPPGGALVQYYTTYWTNFSEGLTYCGQAILALCGVAPLLQRFRWRQAYLALATLAILYLLSHLFENGPASLLVDLVVASFFGGILATYAMNRPQTVKAYVALILPLAVLPILKEVGWTLALLTVALIGGARLCEQLVGEQTVADGPAASPRRSWTWRFVTVGVSTVALMAVLLIAPAIARTTWRQHVKHLNAPPTFAFSLSMEKLRRSFSSETATPRDRVTIDGFKTALRSRPVNFQHLPLIETTIQRYWPRYERIDPQPSRSTSFWVVVLLCLGTVAAACQERRQETVRILVMMVGLLLGCGAYLVGHLLAYLYAFSEFEGTHLASFERYVGIYLLGWAIFTLAAIVRAAVVPGIRGLAAHAVLVLAIAAGVRLAPYEAARFVLDGARPPNEGQRWGLEPKMARLRRVVTPNDTVRIIVQHSTGYEHRVALYEASPAKHGGYWSIGTPSGPDDIWTVRTTPQQFAAELRQVTLLFIVDPGKTFWNEFGELFPPDQRGRLLYRVTPNDSGGVTLRAID